MDLKDKFKNIYGVEAERIFFAPGRVNLIGEHIDYNGGYVLPCPLSIGTFGAIRKNNSNKINCYSYNFVEDGIITISYDDIVYDKKDGWVNYVKGVISEITKLGYKLSQGFDLYVYGEIPNGAGLSSSASLEILVSVILRDLHDLPLTDIDLIKVSKAAENNFIGVQCGIMDQFVIGIKSSSSAVKLNTSTLEYELVPVDFKDNVLIIANTNKKRQLQDSKYNERRSECEKGLEIAKSIYKIDSLCEMNIKQLTEIKDLFDDVIYQRVYHAVSENERTKEACVALKENDVRKFGRLLTASHVSLKNDYEVTGKELDCMVDLFLENGALGARMTGAGFGGCAIALVPSRDVDYIVKNVGVEYENRIGLHPDFYVCQIGSGAREL